VAACVARGDELVGHGHSNAERQGGWTRPPSARCCEQCRPHAAGTAARTRGLAVAVDLGEPLTPDLLAETGYRYTLNWCHDDQPVPMRTRGGGTLWSVPYPQELNDIPMIVARQMDAKDFAQMIIDQFDEMLEQARATRAAGDGHRAAPLPGRPALPAAPPAARGRGHLDRPAARHRGQVLA
jgi:allantoinase